MNYTINQYQRLLKCATRMNNAILDMKKYQLDAGMLNELYEAQSEYLKTQTEIVNETYDEIVENEGE